MKRIVLTISAIVAALAATDGTAQPRSTLDALSQELRQLRSLPTGAPSNAKCPTDTSAFIGLRLEVIREKLGAPDFMESDPVRLSYFFSSPRPKLQFGGGFPELSFTFSSNGEVAEVSCHYAR